MLLAKIYSMTALVASPAIFKVAMAVPGLDLASFLVCLMRLRNSVEETPPTISFCFISMYFFGTGNLVAAVKSTS